MLNQSLLLIVPDSTDLSQKTVHLRLHFHERILSHHVARENSGIQDVQWEAGDEFDINANGTYVVEVKTFSGRTIQKAFSICFLNSQPTFSGGTGSVFSPFLIKTAAQLNAIRSNLNAHYRLISDIDLSSPEWGIGWCPIGDFQLTMDGLGIAVNHKAGFSGCIDGAGHEIKNLSGFYPEKEHVGLFGYLEGTVKNLRLSNVAFVGKNNIGGIAGTFHGTILETSVSGKLAGGDLIGGIVGEIVENALGKSSVIISECEFEGDIIGKLSEDRQANAIGGIAAECSGANTVISNCVVKAQLQFSGGIFGICGCTPTAIINCLAQGRIMTECPTQNSIVYGIGAAYSWTEDCENPDWGVYGCVSAWEEISFSGGNADNLLNTFDHIGIPPTDVKLVSPYINILLNDENIKISGRQEKYLGKYLFEKRCKTISEEILWELGWDFSSVWEMDEKGWPKLRFDNKNG